MESENLRIAGRQTFSKKIEITATMRDRFSSRIALCLTLLGITTVTFGQSVCLPSPRLLTTMPMGGQAGHQVEVTITGQNLEDVDQLLFSHPGITAKTKLNAEGTPVDNAFLVSIAADCPEGVYDARVMSRLGVSSARAFSVSAVSEVMQDKPTTSVETAMPIEVNSICNASLAARAVNHYVFEAKQGQRLIVDCASKGIDSKLNPVLIVADANGNDLVVERRGGALDFTVPENGKYMVKVHDLTFNGGAYYFFRLSVKEIAADAPIVRLPSTRIVNSFSWPPAGLSNETPAHEAEPNNKHPEAQKITLPCDLVGSFFPAADVDTYEFAAKKGETWWVEVASERLGRPTDPSVIVQQVIGRGDDETLKDIVQLADIPSPIKRSSNGYSYDGPPYNAGSSDVLGKLEIKEDGIYRLQVTDLFGGTRNDPRNEYRLVIRKAQPDFAIVAWALHMGLRNGDRNALSKPLSLRGGATIPLEVAVIRRDGFEGEIELEMDNLPDGVTATGLKVGAKKVRGIVLVSAHQDAPRGMTIASIYGRGTIDGKEIKRQCSVASMRWPVPNAKSEIPSPRLLANLPVSVGGSEFAFITIAPKEDKVWEANEGETLRIPLAHTVRGSFSGANISLKTFGSGFERNAAFDAGLKAESSEAVLDLQNLKAKAGDYTVAFYGGAVAKYSYNPDAVLAAEDAEEKAKQHAAELATELKRLAAEASAASKDQKAASRAASQAIAAKKKAADAAVVAATKKVAAAKKAAAPKDIVDIYVSQPVTIRVKPAEKK